MSIESPIIRLEPNRYPSTLRCLMSTFFYRLTSESSHSSYDSAQEELPPDEWMQERMIGRGSFGIVSLWRNQVSSLVHHKV